MRKAALVWSCLLLAGCTQREEPESEPVVRVTVAPVEIAEIRHYVDAPATLFPLRQANIAARLTAPVRKLLAGKGDRVSAGELLAQLDDSDLLAQQAGAVAAVSEARANLEKLSSGVLPTDLERARGAVQTAEAALNQARQIYERRQQLFQQGAIPSRDLLVSQTELAQAQTARDVAVKSLELLQNQFRERDVRIAQSRLEQAAARLKLIEAELAFAELRSPFAGTVTEQFLYPGDMAKADSPVFTVMDLSAAVARAQVAETEVASVRVKQPCAFVPADAAAEHFEGIVTVVNSAVDPARRTVEVWGELTNREGRLRAGVFGTLRILTATAPESLVVPIAAVQFDSGTRNGQILVVDEKRIAHLRKVRCGGSFEGKVAVLQGLDRGETVVVEGGYGLPDGTEVTWGEEKAK